MKTKAANLWKQRATSLWQELGSRLQGEVLWDHATRLLYASDASIFQQIPAAIVRPRNAQDCALIVEFARHNAIPLIPRAAGTSLAGQCVGSGLVIDVVHYMDRVLALDTEKGTVSVEPGVVLQDLNDQLKPHGLMFPVDPSTANRCTLGGMVANNAWGVHTPRYGTTRDHVLSIDALMSDGSSAHFAELNPAQIQHKLALKNSEGALYRCVYHALENHREQIIDGLQPEGVLRSNSGYALSDIAKNPYWKQGLNLATLLCGSEGTLVLMTAIRLKLASLASPKKLVCAHFDTLSDAIDAVALITKHPISALELLDHHILGASANSPAQQQNRFWIQDNPQAVLLIECEQNETDTILQCLQQTECYASPVIAEPHIDKVWALRRAGLVMLMGHTGNDKTVSAIEDAAVPLARLTDYIREIDALMKRYELDCVVYGPVSVGVVHIRPWMDLRQSWQRKCLIELLQEVAKIVHRLGGVISAKHGDGRVRGWLLPAMLDNTLYALLQSIKNAADPLGILNPENLLTSKTPDAALRAMPAPQKTLTETAFRWHQPGGIQGAIARCNGAGVCLKPARGFANKTGSNNTMCPSYQVTRNENHVTRGRANTLRLMFQQNGTKGLASDEVQQAFELCLSCKGCKSECPAGVDMARLKAEALQQRHDQVGIPIQTRLAANFYSLSKFASLSAITKTLFNRALFRQKLPQLFGMHPKRSLPELAPQSFKQWLKQHPSHPDSISHRKNNSEGKPKGNVILINDAQINYYEPNIGIAAVETLEELGFEVLVSPCIESTQVLISHGFLGKAKKQLKKTVSTLLQLIETQDADKVIDDQGNTIETQIIGLEPSELLILRDEATDLLPENQTLMINNLAKKTYLFEEFILKHANSLQPLKTDNPYNILVHEHCHQKSLADPEITQKCLSLINNVTVKTIPSGCCGMAGSFGYQQEHYELSIQIAERVLFPSIRDAAKDTLIVATGASCRKQIVDGTGRKALHPVEVFKGTSINSG